MPILTTLIQCSTENSSLQKARVKIKCIQIVKIEIIYPDCRQCNYLCRRFQGINQETQSKRKQKTSIPNKKFHKSQEMK
jgi:hypothetical protein